MQTVGSNQIPSMSFAPDACTLDRVVIQDLRDLQSPGEPDILQELADLFAQDTPQRLTALQHAATRRDAAELRHVAHSLKGSSGNLGARRLAAVCARLEEMARGNAVDQSAEQLAAYAIEEFTRVRAELNTLGVKI